MTDLFQTVLNMSITGAYIAAAIIILRSAIKKLPKKYSYALWLILGIRLLCPVSFSSGVSMFNILKPETTDNQMIYISQDHEYVPSSETTPVISDTQKSDEIIPDADKKAAVSTGDILSVCSRIWIAGVCIMTAYSVVTYILVNKKVSRSEHLQDNVYICKNISSPFVYGIVKPKIYLSSNIPADETDYILAHEKAHIRRGDHIVKIIALAALSVHWFNPLVWVSYKLMVRDMELSCDDIALRSFERDVRKEYANTLLNMSLRQNKLSSDKILAFGETNIKSRVKSVLSSKKPRTAAIVFAVVIVITAAVCLLTNAESRSDEKLINTSDEELPQEYLSLCGGYLTDLWNDIADKGELDINKYTSDSDMIRLFETISENSEAFAALTEFDRLETVFGSGNVSYKTTDDKTWIYISYYEVFWWSGDEIIQRKEGYDAYFELTEINGRTEIVREYELWQLVPAMGLDRSALTFPLDIDISDVISCYENGIENDKTNSCIMTEDDWDLKLYAEKTELNEGEPLNVYAELKYIGGQDEVKIYGSFSCVHFSLEGDRYFTDGQGAAVVDDILVEHTVKSGEIIRKDYIPSACWSADDPDSAFYEQYVKSDEVILPVGKYTLTVYADFISSDKNRISLRTSADVTVNAAEAR